MATSRHRWLSLVIVLTVLGAAAAGVAIRRHDATAQPENNPIPLSAGWNLIGWTGRDADPAIVLDAIAPGVTRLFAFNPADGTFPDFDPAVPPAVNSLTAIRYGSGLWLLSDGNSSYQPPTPGEPAALELSAGFNLVAWLGSADTPVAEAVASLGGALRAAFVWDAQTQQFERYAPGAPAILNSTRTLVAGDGLWVQMDRPITWELGAGLTSGCADRDPASEEIIAGPMGPVGTDNDSVFRSLTVHPVDPDVVLLGTERNGFLRSTDGGTTWNRHRAGLRHTDVGYPEIWDIAFASADPNLVLAATLDSPGPPTGDYPSAIAGIYRSTDGGQSWTQVVCGLTTSRITSVAFHPTNANIAVLGAEGGAPTFSGLTTFVPGGLFFSWDGGLHWTEGAADSGASRNGYWRLVAGGGPGETFVTFGLNFADPETSLGFLRSRDGGATWAPLGDEGFAGRFIGSFDVSTDGGTWIAHEWGRFAHWVSRDGGETWDETVINQANGPVAISLDDPALILYGSQSKLYRSVDGLATSEVVVETTQPPGHPRLPPFHDIAFAPSDPTVVYAATEGYLVFKSVDAGATWEQVANLRQDVLNSAP